MRIKSDLPKKADKLNVTSNLGLYFYNSSKSDANGFCYTNDIYFPYDGTVTISSCVIYNGSTLVTVSNPLVVKTGNWLHIRNTTPIEGTLRAALVLS